MIKVLVYAVVVVICLFLLALMLCLMIWSVTKLLRFLFPEKYRAGSPKPKKDKKKESAPASSTEYRCGKCADLQTCVAACTGVAYPCEHFKQK